MNKPELILPQLHIVRQRKLSMAKPTIDAAYNLLCEVEKSGRNSPAALALHVEFKRSRQLFERKIHAQGVSPWNKSKV